MSPQQKGVLRPADVERIERALQIKAWAELELVDAVLDAMRHGGSIRETVAVSGLSESTIIRWRRGQGLPTHDDWAAPARERQRRLYEAYPGLETVHQMLQELDKQRADRR